MATKASKSVTFGLIYQCGGLGLPSTCGKLSNLCKRFSYQKNPLYLQTFPSKIGTDIFFIKGIHYLVAVDYFSRYIEVIKLGITTSRNIIDGLKSMFSRYGIPETVVSDNGSQYPSCEFSAFAKAYNFCHIASSPYFPQSNGQAEWAVQTAQQLLTKSEDPYLALLTYRVTPLPWCKHLRTTLPQVEEQLLPKWTYLDKFEKQHFIYK